MNDGVFTAAQFVHDLPAREENQTRVDICVIPNAVIGAHDFRGQCRILLDILTKHEKRRRHAVLF